MLRAGNWEWYYPDNSDTGESIASIAGYSKPSVSALMRYSTAMSREAANILAMTEHRQGEERSYIGVLHMGEAEEGHSAKLDSVVYLAAPDEIKQGQGGKRRNMWRAVQSIEFGHYTTNQRDHEGEGPRTKRDHKRHWVEGVAPLRKAAKTMVRRRRLSI